MMTHGRALRILESVAPELTPSERLVAQSISLHETGYGSGWKPGHGEGSHNWGAITRAASDPGPFFESRDSTPTRSYVGRFRVYATDEEGARDVVDVALKPDVREAANAGDMQGVAARMYGHGYYTGTSPTPAVNVARYRDKLLEAADSITRATGEPNPFPKGSPGASAPSEPSSLPVLQLGAQGVGVSLVAALLERIEPGSGLMRPSDSYTAHVAEVVRQFQGLSGLLQDGICGPKTWRALTDRLWEPRQAGY
jgi:Putative peptidoglycan binding domain